MKFRGDRRLYVPDTFRSRPNILWVSRNDAANRAQDGPETAAIMRDFSYLKAADVLIRRTVAGGRAQMRSQTPSEWQGHEHDRGDHHHHCRNTGEVA